MSEQRQPTVAELDIWRNRKPLEPGLYEIRYADTSVINIVVGAEGSASPNTPEEIVNGNEVVDEEGNPADIDLIELSSAAADEEETEETPAAEPAELSILELARERQELQKHLAGIDPAGVLGLYAACDGVNVAWSTSGNDGEKMRALQAVLDALAACKPRTPAESAVPAPPNSDRDNPAGVHKTSGERCVAAAPGAPNPSSPDAFSVVDSGAPDISAGSASGQGISERNCDV